jgi:hypothetical protein
MTPHPADLANRLEHVAWLLRQNHVRAAVDNAACYLGSAPSSDRLAADPRRFDARALVEHCHLLDATTETMTLLCERWLGQTGDV